VTFCTACGREEDLDQRYCPACGTQSVTPRFPPPAATEAGEQPRRVGGIDDPIWGSGSSSSRGPADANTASLADYGLRLGGWLLDFLIVSLGASALLLALGMFRRTTTQTANGLSDAHGVSFSLSPAGTLLWVAIVLIYVTVMIGTRGQTIGMMATKIKAVRAGDGSSVGYLRALGRGVIEFALLAVLFIPWVIDMLWPIWDHQNRTLHDLITGTVVIKVNPAID
jgi:uncharacterized RDD family membrane protein YckC